MRILFLLAPLLLGSVLAESNPNVNKREDKNDDCTFYANTSIALINISWPKNTMVRRRVVYETTKKLDRYDQTMWDHGWKWAEGQEEKCNATAGNVNVYYHGVVIPGGAYVVEADELLGYEGQKAHDCMLSLYKEYLGRELGCTLQG